MSSTKKTHHFNKKLIKMTFDEPNSRMKRPILHALIRQSSLYGEICKSSKAIARKTFCEYFDVIIEPINFYYMLLPLPKSRLKNMEILIDPETLADFEDKQLKN